MKTNFSSANEWLKEWCEFVTEWKPNMHFDQERCLWLRCYGVPLNLWNRETFSKLGGIWRKVLHIDGDISHPVSFCYGRVRIATKCMEWINKAINLECKGRVASILVCEEQFIDASDHNLSINVEEIGSSNKVVRKEHEGPIRLKKEEGAMAKRVEMAEVELASSDDVALDQRSEHICGSDELDKVNGNSKEEHHCSRDVVDTVVKEIKEGMGSNFEVDARMANPKKEKAIELRHVDSYDNQRLVGHLYTPGFIRNLSTSIGLRPGINLEIDLGNIIHHHGPIDTNLNRIVPINSASDGSVVRPIKGKLKTDTSHVKRDQLGTNKLKTKAKLKRNKKGKSKILFQFEIVSNYVRLHGHKGASSSKLPLKKTVFRAAVAAMTLSASSENGDKRGRYVLNKAQATMQIGKILGLTFNGKKSDTINKIVELELKDKERNGEGKQRKQ
ncbi:hypothetical protein CsSME_00031545 [Camellia sinensis var. sinensis]